MRKHLYFFYFLFLAPGLAYADPPTTSVTPATSACAHPGVLIKCLDGVQGQGEFSKYIATLLKDNFPLLLFIAVVMIVASGIQYMLSGFTPDGAKQAKQRISGILIGIIFLLLIRLLANLLTPNLSV